VTDQAPVFDPFDPDTIQCPYPAYEQMRAEQPVLKLPAAALGRGGEFIYCVSTHELVSEVLTDWRTFSSKFGSARSAIPAEMVDQIAEIRSEGWPDVPTMLTADPPDHNRYRRLVGKAFTVRRVQSYRDAIRDICDDLVDGFGEGGSVEFVTSFAVPVPVRAVAYALGVPQDREADFKSWADMSVASIGRDLTQDQWLDSYRAIVAQQQYFAAELEARREEPRDDLLSDLLNAVLAPEDGVEGAPLDTGEMLSIIRQLSVAGSETTTSLLTDIMVLIDGSPGLWEQMQSDPSEISNVVEEGLRWSTPNQGLYRIATRDVELGGVTIPKGATVWVMFGSANRDADVFEDPDEFCPGRDRVDRHVAFGKGVHFCLGASLARLEAQVALETLTERVASFKVTNRDTLQYGPSYVLRGLQRLELDLDLRG
jgi:cytochrome P450